MPNATVFTSSGTKSAKTVALKPAVFEVKFKDGTLIQQAYQAYLAGGRNAHAKTLRRGEVSGGGRKPWRQKGTGRARAGSSRMPHWRGGGVTFGPTGNENYQLNLPKKARRLAIRQALSLKAKDGAIKIIENFQPKEGKVKEAVQLLKKLDAQRRVLLVVADRSDLINRATANLAEVETVKADYLNVFRIINADQIIITQDALKAIEAW